MLQNLRRSKVSKMQWAWSLCVVLSFASACKFPNLLRLAHVFDGILVSAFLIGMH